MVRERETAGDELDVLAAAAVGALHDYFGVSAQGARCYVVGRRGVREAGVGSVSVWFRGGGGDVVQGLNVGDFEVFDVDFGCRGEGADEAAWVRGLQGLDGGVDGGKVGGWRARVRGPVEEDYAGGVGVGE